MSKRTLELRAWNLACLALAICCPDCPVPRLKSKRRPGSCCRCTVGRGGVSGQLVRMTDTPRASSVWGEGCLVPGVSEDFGRGGLQLGGAEKEGKDGQNTCNVLCSGTCQHPCRGSCWSAWQPGQQQPGSPLLPHVLWLALASLQWLARRLAPSRSAQLPPVPPFPTLCLQLQVCSNAVNQSPLATRRGLTGGRGRCCPALPPAALLPLLLLCLPLMRIVPY